MGGMASTKIPLHLQDDGGPASVSVMGWPMV